MPTAVMDTQAAPAFSDQADTSMSASSEATTRWPGYLPLTASDSTRLMGRDEEIEKIVRAFARPKTGQSGLVWLHGDSAVGKTSLIEAGIRPALVEEFGKGFHSVRVIPEEGDNPDALIEAIAEAILEASPDENGMALDLGSRARQFSLMNGQDPAEAAEYLASSFKRSRPAGAGKPNAVGCLIVIDELDRFAPEGTSILQASETWQKNHLCPVLKFLHELILTGMFPCLVALRSVNMEPVKSALALGDDANLGTWIELDPVSLDVVRPFFQMAPAELSDSDHVNVEPMLLDALIEDAGSTSMGIPFISETLRKLSEIDPASEDLSTADAGWTGGVSEKYAAAAERSVPDGLDDNTLGELMLSLQRRVRSGKKKGETISSTAPFSDLVGRSELSRRFIENLVDARVLHLSGTGLERAEIQWSIPLALKSWGRAREWFKEENRRLETAQRFEEKRKEWEKEDRSPVLLVHAERALDDARNLLAHHQRRSFLSDEVLAYITESLDLDERLSGEIKGEQMKVEGIKWGAIGLGALLLIVVLWLIFR